MRLLRAALLGSTLAGCAVNMPGPPLPVTNRSLTDDYLLARGLAEGAIIGGVINRDQLFRIVTLDHAALIAYKDTLTEPSDLTRARAQRAIEALAEYAASLDPSSPHPNGITHSQAP